MTFAAGWHVQGAITCSSTLRSSWMQSPQARPVGIGSAPPGTDQVHNDAPGPPVLSATPMRHSPPAAPSTATPPPSTLLAPPPAVERAAARAAEPATAPPSLTNAAPPSAASGRWGMVRLVGRFHDAGGALVFEWPASTIRCAEELSVAGPGFCCGTPPLIARNQHQCAGRALKGSRYLFAWRICIPGEEPTATFTSSRLVTSLNAAHHIACSAKMILKGQSCVSTTDDSDPTILDIQPDNTAYLLAQGLGPGRHTVGIMKRTESIVGAGIFKGFDIGPPGRLLPACPSAHGHECPLPVSF